MTYNDLQWLRMTNNDLEWLRMTENGLEWPRITESNKKSIVWLMDQQTDRPTDGQSGL